MPTDPTFISETLVADAAVRTPMTRRQLLRTMAAGSTALVGGAVLAACGSTGSAPTAANVTLTTAGWPFGAMPTKAEISKSSVNKAYADSLQRWLNKNPGVTIKSSSANIWDMQALGAAVAAGTAPTWYPADVLGGWNPPLVLAALARGLSADVTDLVGKYNIQGELADYAAVWLQHKKVYGKYHIGPFAVNAGTGIYYRRDWLQQAGLQDPKEDWTWDDVRKYAKALTKGKVYGAGFEAWGIQQNLGASQQGLFTTIPSPNTGWHWRYDYLSKLDEWENLVNLERGMYFQDKSMLSQANWTGTDAIQAFSPQEKTAMMLESCIFMTQWPESATNVIQLATKYNKPIGEIVGYQIQPGGIDGAFGASQSQMDTVAFEPHMNRNQTALTKAFDLYYYFILGQGYIDQKVALWQSTKDLHRVYDSVTPLKTSFLHLPGVPGTIEDAYGTQYVQTVLKQANIPLVPQPAWYFPPEKNAGMTNNAMSDANNALLYSQKDIKAIYTNLQNVQNQQAATLTSSVSSTDFISAAKQYYSAHSDFWQKYAPTFYANQFQPFYQQKILPALGG